MTLLAPLVILQGPPEALFIVLLVLGVPLGVLAVIALLILTYHKRKMEELRLRHNGLNADVRAELNAIRQEVRDLRDTALQYDLSFDSALQQVEGRLSRLEGRRPVTQGEAEELRVQTRPY